MHGFTFFPCFWCIYFLFFDIIQQHSIWFHVIRYQIFQSFFYNVGGVFEGISCVPSECTTAKLSGKNRETYFHFFHTSIAFFWWVHCCIYFYINNKRLKTFLKKQYFLMFCCKIYPIESIFYIISFGQNFFFLMSLVKKNPNLWIFIGLHQIYSVYKLQYILILYSGYN